MAELKEQATCVKLTLNGQIFRTDIRRNFQEGEGPPVVHKFYYKNRGSLYRQHILVEPHTPSVCQVHVTKVQFRPTYDA